MEADEREIAGTGFKPTLSFSPEDPVIIFWLNIMSAKHLKKKRKVCKDELFTFKIYNMHLFHADFKVGMKRK